MRENLKKSDDNLQIQTYGKRIFNSQTVGEYFLEFLLVFLGVEKEKDGSLCYDNTSNNKVAGYRYLMDPHIGLKRFILYEKTKMESRFDVDTEAYNKINQILKKKIDSSDISEDDILSIVRNLFNGFTMVTGDRGWFAQSLMPICKETIFCEAIGSKSSKPNENRTNLVMINDSGFNLETETKFNFKQHLFLARGGEVYFMHLMQGLNEIAKEQGKEKAYEYLQELNFLIFTLINSYPEFSNLAKWIENSWTNYIKDNSIYRNDSFEDLKKELSTDGKCQWIPNEYNRRSKYAVLELINILKADINPIDKMNLISKGIVFQILRMMSELAFIQARAESGNNRSWIIHFNSNSDADSKIKRVAIENYKNIEEDHIIAVSQKLQYINPQGNQAKKSDIAKLKEASLDSYKLLRKLGKDIGIIIPIKGDNMRLTLSDEIIRFLVLAIVPTTKKITLDTFLNKLYEQFGLIIGPKQLIMNQKERGIIVSESSYLNNNLEQFQSLLKMNGFLKELSDAISIVINPYESIREE